MQKKLQLQFQFYNLKKIFHLQSVINHLNSMWNKPVFFVFWTLFLKYLTRKNIHDEATVFLGFKMKEFNMAFDPVISYQLGKQVLNWT